jgi:hypothetical protein
MGGGQGAVTHAWWPGRVPTSRGDLGSWLLLAAILIVCCGPGRYRHPRLNRPSRSCALVRVKASINAQDPRGRRWMHKERQWMHKDLPGAATGAQDPPERLPVRPRSALPGSRADPGTVLRGSRDGPARIARRWRVHKICRGDCSQGQRLVRKIRVEARRRNFERSTPTGVRPTPRPLHGDIS